MAVRLLDPPCFSACEHPSMHHGDVTSAERERVTRAKAKGDILLTFIRSI
jgi:hypothetical protein